MGKLKPFLIQNLVVGILVLVPFAAAVYVIAGLLNFSDNFLFHFLPSDLHPDHFFGFHIPGLGIVLTFLIILMIGLLTRNFLGKQLLKAFEGAISHIPLFRGVYSAVRQFLESLLMNRQEAFRKVVAIEYPRKGIFTIAFVTGTTAPYLKGHLGTEKLYTVFVPTTPNPTAGFYLILPEAETIELPMKVEDAFRLVISCGVLSGKGSSL